MSELEERLRSRLSPAPAATEASEPPPADAPEPARSAPQNGRSKPKGAKPPRGARGGASGGEGGAQDAEAPSMSAGELQEWQWRLGSAARKVVAARQKAQQSEDHWRNLVVNARASGVPFHLLIAAAAAVNVELPD